MKTVNERQIMEKFFDEKWSTEMDALETTWLATIESTRSEYNLERPSLNGEWRGSEIISAVFVKGK